MEAGSKFSSLKKVLLYLLSKVLNTPPTGRNYSYSKGTITMKEVTVINDKYWA